MNIKKIIREEMGDSLQWMQDVKSNQDIAQEIADKSKIKDNLITPPFSLPPYSPLSLFSLPPPLFSHSWFLSFAFLLPPFLKYCKEQYGLTEEESNDVWDRYKKIMKSRARNLNESDFDWIEDIPGIEVGACYKYVWNLDPLVVQLLNVPQLMKSKVYFRNLTNGYIVTIPFDRMIEELDSGDLIPC